jgi:hypothetical protein
MFFIFRLNKMNPTTHVSFLFVTLFFIAMVVLLMYNDDYWSRKLLKSPRLYGQRGHGGPQEDEEEERGGDQRRRDAPPSRSEPTISFAPTTAMPTSTPAPAPPTTPVLTPLPTPNPPQDTTLSPPPTSGISTSSRSPWDMDGRQSE